MALLLDEDRPDGEMHMFRVPVVATFAILASGLNAPHPMRRETSTACVKTSRSSLNTNGHWTNSSGAHFGGRRTEQRKAVSDFGFRSQVRTVADGYLQRAWWLFSFLSSSPEHLDHQEH